LLLLNLCEVPVSSLQWIGPEDYSSIEHILIDQYFFLLFFFFKFGSVTHYDCIPSYIWVGCSSVVVVDKAFLSDSSTSLPACWGVSALDVTVWVNILLCYVRLQEDPPAGVSGAPTDNNIMLWNAVIFGYVHW